MSLPALLVSAFAAGFGGVKASEPLHHAARTGNVIQAHLALMRCPNAVNALGRITKERSPTPVHLAAYWNNVGVLKLLLAHGGRVNDPGDSGQTPLQHAASRGSADTARLLLERGATLDIFSAVAFDKCDEVQSLFRAVSLIGWQKQLANIRSDGPGWGPTPLLSWAIEGGRIRMVEFLVDCGAEVNPFESPLSISEYWSPLHKALYKRRLDIAELLIRKGAKIETQDCNGFTPLHLAVAVGDVNAVHLMLKHGAKVDTRRDSYAPRASMPNGDPRTFDTPLHSAAKYEKPELVALLLAHGASVTERNASGQTPTDLAAEVPWELIPVRARTGDSQEPSAARIRCLKLLLRYGGTPAKPRQ